ncbi:sulfatase [Acidobacteria bacterium AH-259-O06]|nr:sulfatase [Acidobacteria bacterium AH-259-O06]
MADTEALDPSKAGVIVTPAKKRGTNRQGRPRVHIKSFFICLLISLSIAIWLIAQAGQPKVRAAERLPNIIFILADDLGWTDLGCFGSKYYQTPSIDRLCAQGMKFTSAYTNGPNCAPTRASLMSGQYTPRHGIYTVNTGARGLEKFRKLIPVKNERNLPLSEVTVADVLEGAGYTTAHFGKWHLGNDDPYHPSKRGFDKAIVTGGRHFAPNFRTRPNVSVNAGVYLADFLTDLAVKFIEDNKDRSFFLYLCHFAVHTPIEAKQESIGKYKDKSPVGGHHDPVYAGMIDSLDQSVGRIMAKLDELTLSENTIVVFYSDNGGVGGYGNIGGSTGRNITDNAPLHGGKGMLYEGGVRVPLIIRWPRVVQAGSVCREPVIGIDFYPTFLEIAGGRRSPEHQLDGESILPLLKSTGHASLNRDAIYWHFPGYLQANTEQGTWRTTPAGSIRSGNYKLIEFFEDDHVELYNLKDDIGERIDLASRMPKKARQLLTQLRKWRRGIDAKMPKSKADL